MITKDFHAGLEEFCRIGAAEPPDPDIAAGCGARDQFDGAGAALLSVAGAGSAGTGVPLAQLAVSSL